eukprot:1032480-Pelagomonas_calceolata.AAC.1
MHAHKKKQQRAIAMQKSTNAGNLSKQVTGRHTCRGVEPLPCARGHTSRRAGRAGPPPFRQFAVQSA